MRVVATYESSMVGSWGESSTGQSSSFDRKDVMAVGEARTIFGHIVAGDELKHNG